MGSASKTSYPGNKAATSCFARIINLMPPHRVYVEPFLGSGGIMRLKRPAEFNIGLDLDPAALELARRDLWSAGVSSWTVRGDGLDFLRTHIHRSDELVYADPPYVVGSRRSGARIYRHEFTDDQHRELLDWANETGAMVILSGYASNLYDDALKLPKWNRMEFTSTTRRGRAIEVLWWNFPRPDVLHDSRFLGDGFRDRERIRRRASRWLARLERMDPAERAALVSAVFSVSLLDGSGEIGRDR